MPEENFEQKNENEFKKFKGLLIFTLLLNAISVLLLTYIVSVIFLLNVNIRYDNSANMPIVKKIKKTNTILKTISYEEALTQDKTMVVLFYSDRCPHCVKFKPVFNKFLKNKNLMKKYNFIAIDTNNPSSKDIINDYKIEYIPALFLKNPKNDDKFLIPNSTLFIEDAEKSLPELFNAFDKKIK